MKEEPTDPQKARKTKRGLHPDKPVKNLRQFMSVLTRLQKKMKKQMKDDAVGPIEQNLFLYRGMATDKFEIVGRIQHDKNYLRDDYNCKDTVENVEKEILHNFIQRARIFNEILPKDDWEWIALARHHGVPTRILDWSRDPQIGLWFAVQDEKAFMHEMSVFYMFYPSKKYKIQHGGNMFTTSSEIVNDHKYHNFNNPFEIDRQNPPEIILYKPSSLNLRIDYQSSWFTVHPYDRKEKRYTALKKEDRGELRKIYISNQHTHSIRKELAKVGIDTASVYKDLDSIGKYIKEKRFKQSDEIFTDEMMKPDNIVGTFKQLQGIIGLYNSDEVESIQYHNMIGMYNELNRILSAKKYQPTMLKTFNNTNREFLIYRNQRELFLRLIENRFRKKELKYKRIQFCNIAPEIAKKQKTQMLNNDSTPIDVEDLSSKKLFENIMVWTDGISKKHVINCEDIERKDGTKGGITKYLLMNDEAFNQCGFCIIETQKPKADKKNNKIYYLVIEFNHDYLNAMIGEMQNLSFLLKFKKCKDTPKIIQEYIDKFKYYFKIHDPNKKWAYNLLDYDAASEIIHEKRKQFKEKVPEDYVMVQCFDWDKKEPENAESIIKEEVINKVTYYRKYTELLIPLFDCHKRIQSIHELHDYIFNKIRWNHPACLLREFSYGNKRDWFLTELHNDDPIVFYDELNPLNLQTDNAGDSDIRKTHNKRYFYSEIIKDQEKIVPGETYKLEYGKGFLFRSNQLNDKTIQKKPTTNSNNNKSPDAK